MPHLMQNQADKWRDKSLIHISTDTAHNNTDFDGMNKCVISTCMGKGCVEGWGEESVQVQYDFVHKYIFNFERKV
jgi:hypothetical protein